MGLFDNVAGIGCFRQDLGPGAVLLPGFALPDEALLLAALHQVIEQAPFRHMVTPGGFPMSVAMTTAARWGGFQTKLVTVMTTSIPTAAGPGRPCRTPF